MSHLAITASSQLAGTAPLPPFSTPKSLLWSLQQIAHCASPDELLVLHNDHVPCHDDRRPSWRMKGGRNRGFGGVASSPLCPSAPFPSRRQRVTDLTLAHQRRWFLVSQPPDHFPCPGLNILILGDKMSDYEQAFGFRWVQSLQNFEMILW